MKSLLLLLITLQATAQQNPPPKSSISGTVRDATGVALGDVTVSVGRSDTITDANGHYTLKDLAAGPARINAMPKMVPGLPFGRNATRVLNIGPGQDLSGIDLTIRVDGELSGRVLDQNKESVPEAAVALIAREYWLGSIRYVYAGMARADDRGEYHLPRVAAGIGYLLMASLRPQKADAVSDLPVDPKWRRQVFEPVFYPGVASIESAQPLTLRPGEKREGIDLRITRSPSYCVEGVVSPAAALNFQIDEAAPTSGASGNGSMFVGSPSGQTADDGKLRLCGLHSGEYRIVVNPPYAFMANPPMWGATSLTIGNKDVTNVIVAAKPPLRVLGEVLWDGPAPQTPESQRLSLSVMPMTRTPFGNEFRPVEVNIPGPFAFESLVADAYSIQANRVPAADYIKDITYGGRSVLREPFVPGTAMGDATLRIVLAGDGGTIKAKIAEKDGTPVPDSYVIVVPAGISSEAELASLAVTGQTDQDGGWTSRTMAPGKYLVFGSTTPFDRTPERVGTLWRSRTQATACELAPRASLQLTVVPSAP
jgi:Carboxypeptidase regulatory-like domain